MNEQAVRLMALASTRTKRADLLELSRALTAAHEQELARLRAFLTGEGHRITNPHEGHEMPGMLTQAALQQISTLSDRPFEQALVKHLRAHLEQSAKVCGAAETAGSHPQAITLAIAMRQTRQTALQELPR